MNKFLVAAACTVVAVSAALFTGSALGKSKASDFMFKGKWDVTLFTPLGDFPAVVSLQPNGKGKLWLGDSILPVVHQSSGEWISWTVELPAVQAPDGNGHTITGRGIIGEEGTVEGVLVILTTVQDNSSPVGFETHVGTFGADKKGR